MSASIGNTSTSGWPIDRAYAWPQSTFLRGCTLQIIRLPYLVALAGQACRTHYIMPRPSEQPQSELLQKQSIPIHDFIVMNNIFLQMPPSTFDAV